MKNSFGTAYETFKEAVKVDSSIRFQTVTDFMNKRDDVQAKSKPRGTNSFVSPGAKFEFEICIMDMESKYATSNARYGLAAIDNFTN